MSYVFQQQNAESCLFRVGVTYVFSLDTMSAFSLVKCASITISWYTQYAIYLDLVYFIDISSSPMCVQAHSIRDYSKLKFTVV